MECEPVDAPKITQRHKCSACYKQYKKKEHLVEHMRVQYHSFHEPVCGVCRKHCKTFESVREHFAGPLPKVECARIYTARGCNLCLNIFYCSNDRDVHQEACRLSPAFLPEHAEMSPMDIDIQSPMLELPDAIHGLEAVAPRLEPLSLENGPDATHGLEAVAPRLELLSIENGPDATHGLEAIAPRLEPLSLENGPDATHGLEAVALDCEMVGGGSDGSLDLCARVCLINEDESVIFHSYVTPRIPITNYRYEITGIEEEHLKDAMPLKEVQEKVYEILYNGEALWKIRLEGGKARVLVGHDLSHDLSCLEMNYPDHLLRDTAKYLPLMKTNKISQSLKYLTQTYLGYEIQTGIHEPYEDCVAAMRLYKRMRSQAHPLEQSATSNSTHKSNVFDVWKQKNLESMTPDALLEVSRSNYKCWCLDSSQVRD